MPVNISPATSGIQNVMHKCIMVKIGVKQKPHVLEEKTKLISDNRGNVKIQGEIKFFRK